MSEDPQRSESGAPVYRHKARKPRDEDAAPNTLGERIAAHIEKHLGPIQASFLETESDLVQLDLKVVGPSEERPFYTVVTSGMSARPMKAPEGMAECRYAELLICLPLDWPILDREALADERRYWPLRWLKTLARFPHEYDTWLYWQHTVPNGEPPQPFAPDTELCSILLLDPLLAPPEFARLELEDEDAVHFFALIPLYADELAFKLEHGGDALEHRLRRAGVDELLHPARPSVCD